VPKRPPAELRKEIAQLEDERRQLVDKIAGLKKRTAETVRALPRDCLPFC
jgi:chorismate mutase